MAADLTDPGASLAAFLSWDAIAANAFVGALVPPVFAALNFAVSPLTSAQNFALLAAGAEADAGTVITASAETASTAAKSIRRRDMRCRAFRSTRSCPGVVVRSRSGGAATDRRLDDVGP